MDIWRTLNLKRGVPMCLSTYLAFVIGAYLLLVNLAYLLNRHHYRKFMSDYGGHDALTYVAGTVSLAFGLMIVAAHNIWVADWPVLITIVGWIAVIQGAGRLFFPEHFCHYCKNIHTRPNYWVISVIWALIGIYLIYEGFLMMGPVVAQ